MHERTSGLLSGDHIKLGIVELKYSLLRYCQSLSRVIEI